MLFLILWCDDLIEALAIGFSQFFRPLAPKRGAHPFLNLRGLFVALAIFDIENNSAFFARLGETLESALERLITANCDSDQVNYPFRWLN